MGCRLCFHSRCAVQQLPPINMISDSATVSFWISFNGTPARSKSPPSSMLGNVACLLPHPRQLHNIIFLFSVIPTLCNLWLSFGKRILLKVLFSIESCRAKMPSLNDVRECQHLIQAKRPSLDDVWGAMDSLKLTVEASANDET